MRLGAGILAALAVLLAGCGSTGSSADASAELEALIREQLPAEAKRFTGSRAFVSDVGCINSSGSSYQCIATISGVNAFGGYGTERLPIDGTCDEAQCIWKVSP